MCVTCLYRIASAAPQAVKCPSLSPKTLQICRRPHRHHLSEQNAPMHAAAASSSPFPAHNLRTPDDTVFYSLYPDDAAADNSPLTSLHSLHLHILTAILPAFVPRDYIWQHEPFHLTPAPTPVPHLRGATRFGDNLDDEWLVASLLFHVSRLLPSLSVQIYDSDGDLLLIEAALHIPRWLRPDNSRNRVFIRGGRLHIIPRRHFPQDLTLESALSILKSGEIDTRASDSVQAAIEKKIAGYPERAVQNMHRVRVRVPLPVALVLKHEPCLISLAVEGFYDRDVDSMKHAARMEKFLRSGEGSREVEMVTALVTMSRPMYGQLVQQNFQGPKCYPMPGRTEVGSVGYTEAEIGMKIACGFKMMYQERKMVGEQGKGGTWEAFVNSLESSGVFQGLLPGSKEYRSIMDNAMEYYKNSSLSSRSRDMMNAPLRRIDEVLALPHSANDFNCSELPPPDGDSWLYNGEDELNAAIEERQKETELYEVKHRNRKSEKQKLNNDDPSMQSDDFNFKDVAESMQAFIQKLSSFEGAEVPQNRNSNEVELDVDQFIKDMESVVGPVWHEKAVPDADFDEGSTSSSDMDFDQLESDTAEPYGGDDNEDIFMESYSDALNKELNATTLQKSFIRAPQQPSNGEGGTSKASEEMDEELTPVDVDVNLVKSFLDSFSSQEGLPGPASNLLGLVGLNLPHGANNK